MWYCLVLVDLRKAFDLVNYVLISFNLTYIAVIETSYPGSGVILANVIYA